MTITKLSTSPPPSTALGYDPYAGTFRILQRDWLTSVMSELGISKPTAFDLLKKSQQRGVVFVDPSAGPRKTVLSWDLPRLVDSIGDAIDEQSVKAGERYRGPLGYWPLLEDVEELFRIHRVLEEDDHDFVTESFLERYRRCRSELETKRPFAKKTGQRVRLTAISLALNQLVTETGFKELVVMVDWVHGSYPFETINSWETTKYSHFIGSLEERTKLYESVGEPSPPSTDDTGLRKPDWVLKSDEEKRRKLERILEDPVFAEQFLAEQKETHQRWELHGSHDGATCQLNCLLSVDRVKQRLDELTQELEAYYETRRQFDSRTASPALSP